MFKDTRNERVREVENEVRELSKNFIYNKKHYMEKIIKRLVPKEWDYIIEETVGGDCIFVVTHTHNGERYA